MRYQHVVAFALLPLAVISDALAQTSNPASEVIVTPFRVEAGDADSLRSQSISCFEQFVTALTRNGVKVARDPHLSEKNLRSAPASWAVLGRISRDKEQVQLELRLLDVKSGDEIRSYFNADKDLKVACSGVDKIAKRIASFVNEQRG